MSKNSINHLAIIMDGNGRWAKQQNQPRAFGHQSGAETAKKIINEMIRISSKYVIIIEPSYQFSNQVTRNRILHNGFPILKKAHFENSKAKIIYRDGLPFTYYGLYAEITILEIINKSEGNPIMRHPINYKQIKLDNEFIICDKKRTKINDGIIDFSLI